MKAIVTTKQGSPDGLQLQEIETPRPGNNEVLTKVHAATVTAGDVVLRKLHPLLFIPFSLFGIKRKRTPGQEFSGVVEAVGQAVTQFKLGDPVFGTTTGLTAGANAEYVCLPETWKTGVLTLKPANMTHEEAAAVPVGGLTALYFLRQAKIQPGDKVLIYGASGSVGTFAVQLAKHFGADVTGVCSTGNVELVESLGADHVIDYTRENLAQNAETYGIIFDAVGKITPSDREKALAPNGTFVTVAKGTAKEQTEDLVFLRELIEAGAVKAVIDKRYPLDQTAEAHRYVETGRKRGNVVITVVQENQH